LWNATEMLDTESQESYAEWSSILRAGSVIGHFGVLVPLACIGVLTTWSRRRRLWPLYALPAAYSASVVLFFVYARYRYPPVPFLVLFAAAGLMGATAFVRTQTRLQIAVAAVAIGVVVVFTNWPVLSGAQMRAI